MEYKSHASGKEHGDSGEGLWGLWGLWGKTLGKDSGEGLWGKTVGKDSGEGRMDSVEGWMIMGGVAGA